MHHNPNLRSGRRLTLTACLVGSLALSLGAQTPAGQAPAGQAPAGQAPTGSAQRPDATPARPNGNAPQGRPFVVLRFPQDKGTVVAVVDGRGLTLDDLVQHLDARHHPGFAKALAERPEIQRLLQSDDVARWVRQFADVTALQAEAEARHIEGKVSEAALADALKRGFQGWLDGYTQNLAAGGHPTDLSQARVNRLLADYQLHSGLDCELQGWLDTLEKGDYTRPQINEFFQGHPRYFGGMVSIAHILIQHRDPGTGILLTEAGRGQAFARLQHVQAALKADGSNFEELAREFSEDAGTASGGGLLANVMRFDDRLPAALCRAAWELQDGQISGVVESQYGWHIVKRLDFSQKYFPLLNDAAVPMVTEVMKRARQEDVLFAARKRHGVELRL